MGGSTAPGRAARSRCAPDLAGLATFTLDRRRGELAGRWPADELFGQHRPGRSLGRDVCDVLLTGPGQRDLIGQALAEVAAGRVWTGTVAGAAPGEAGCDPL